MIISFFEEFPTKANLKKLDLVDFPTKLYLAAHSIEQFKKLKQQIKNPNVKEIIFWPILKPKEGYWISPFTKREALKHLFNSIPKNTPVMLDLELPTRQNPLLYLTQLHNFIRNKRLIQNFINNHKKLYLCSYFADIKPLYTLGVEYKHKANQIKMAYSSCYDHGEKSIKGKIKQQRAQHGDKFILALGTLCKGILNTEPAISTSLLKRDLILAKNNNVKEIILFRLGGFNNKYKKLLKEL